MGAHPSRVPMAGTDLGPYGNNSNTRSRLAAAPPGLPLGAQAHGGVTCEWGRPGLEDPGADRVAGDGAGHGAAIIVGGSDQAGMWAGRGRVTGASAGGGLACGGRGGAGVALPCGAGGVGRVGAVGPGGEVEVVVSGGGSDGECGGAARAGQEVGCVAAEGVGASRGGGTGSGDGVRGVEGLGARG